MTYAGRTLLSLTFVLSAAACGPSAEGTLPDGGGPTGTPCVVEGEHRCDGSSYQECRDGEWWEVESCSSPLVCTRTAGCAQCDPDFPGVCQGDNVYECNPDGTIGEFVETCQFEQCSRGSCGDDECGAAGVELIYVVDVNYNLASFDPANNNTFTFIGPLSCPAGPSWPDWGSPTATPFSMSVDRNATAWVLYTSGEIFHVSTQDASCQATNFVPGQQGFELFGMGFVVDEQGGNTEKLYVSGGPAIDLSTGASDLAFIDPATMALTSVAPLPSGEYSPELTGTGNAELYGYYPGSLQTRVSRFNRATGVAEQSWNLPSLNGSVSAWAFAHWGGRFYIFVTTLDDITFEERREVWLLDPVTGNASLLLSNIPYVIVGAGVSTCAPVIIE
jgi:hypothetical protein